MENKINIKIILLDIFPSLEEVNNNNSDITTISFQDNNLSYNLSEFLSTKKEISLSFPQNTSKAKLSLYKNDIIYASGLLSLKNCEQWITLEYENKKEQTNSNIALSLLDCIKLKINCKTISGDITENNYVNIVKKNKEKLRQKLIAIKKVNDDENIDSSIELFNTEGNMMSNRSYEKEEKPHGLSTSTTINKNKEKKIGINLENNNKLNNKKMAKASEKLKYISLTIPSTSKNFDKIGNNRKKSDSEKASLFTEINPKTKNKTGKRSYENINNLNLNSKKQCKNSNSTKNMKKRKSSGAQKLNLEESYNKKENGKNEKMDKKSKKGKTKINKKRSFDKTNRISRNVEDNKMMKSSDKTEKELDSTSKEKFKENNKLYNLLTENNENNEKEVIISHDVEEIQDDDINVQSSINEFNMEDIETDIFSKQLEDFQLLYNDEYIKTINNDYIKLEIELFIEKIIELTSFYNNKIEEKNLEYQILKNKYLNNISKFIEIQKLVDKLRIIKTKLNLKKHNLKEIEVSYLNNSINNLITNKQEVRIFNNNLIEEIQKKNAEKKSALKKIIEKLIENSKNKSELNKNEKFKNWLKKNTKAKELMKKKEKSHKNIKDITKKGLANKDNNLNNKKLTFTKTNYGNFRKNEMNKEYEGKNKNKNKNKIKK